MVDADAVRGAMRNMSLWSLLPPMYAVCTAIGLWVVYFVAGENETITPLTSPEYKNNGTKYPPFISIAGNFPPASCIFSQVMNLAAFVGFIIVVFRYLQLRHREQKVWLNVGSLALLSLACFGMTLIGNFQLFSQESPHNLGTFLTFGLGTLSCWLQSFITFRVNLREEGRKVGVVRFLLSASITLCMVLYFSLLAVGLYMHAARTQWVLVMFLLAFFGTFAIEFRYCHFHLVCTDNRENPVSQSEAFPEVSESDRV
ncbi:hypothetical protein LDENG_00177310 [Lucifuga dentata]|nr:hypothetical protein LDENG_00177310 [Lucifuga dentata]